MRRWQGTRRRRFRGWNIKTASLWASPVSCLLGGGGSGDQHPSCPEGQNRAAPDMWLRETLSVGGKHAPTPSLPFESLAMSWKPWSCSQARVEKHPVDGLSLEDGTSVRASVARGHCPAPLTQGDREVTPSRWCARTFQSDPSGMSPVSPV